MNVRIWNISLLFSCTTMEIKICFITLCRVSIAEIQEHSEFDIDTNGEVSVEEAMVCA